LDFVWDRVLCFSLPHRGASFRHEANFSRRSATKLVMKSTAIVLVASLLLGGCAGNTGSGGRTAEPVTNAATQQRLRTVDVRYGIYLARLEVHTTITSDGLLRSARTQNKSYGPRDIDPKPERTEIREGRLTPEQMKELAALFAGWDSLSNAPYGGVPDGGDIRILYGEKAVSGGSAAPRQVWDVKARISELAARMPVVEK
jgi:predicted small secreted protein